MKFTRRTFLRGASLSLASVGSFFHNVIITKKSFADYSQVLAESTPRKLALLIGIDKYSHQNQLRGCVTDVKLQEKLLINRFQFHPDDIISLTDKQATKQAILTSFEEHLAKQAQIDDVVVIHFSGYGRQVKLPNSEVIANSLILADTMTTSKQNQSVNDLLLDTLINLCETLKTKKYTLILDTSYQSFSKPIPDRLWLRSYNFSGQELPTISPEEFEFDQQLNQQIKNPLKKIKTDINNYEKISGVLITTSPEDLATEITSNNFNAGLLTYNLTQSLWQSLSTYNNLAVLKDINSQMGIYTFDGDKISILPNKKTELSPYYLALNDQTKGEGIITKFIAPNNVELELLGLPLFIFANYNQNSVFRTQLDTGETIYIQINSVTGNKAKGVITNNLAANINLPEGLILHEFWRVINRNKGLTVALDNSLSKIEKVDATSALSSMANIESVINIGDNFADCILGKFKQNSGDSKQNDSYALFSISGQLFPNTIAKIPHEAVTTAVKRLSQSLKYILAEKLLHLTLNYQSSSLPVNVNLKISNENQTINTFKKTLSSKKKSANDQLNTLVNQSVSSFLHIPFGSQLQLKVDNDNDLDLYCIVLAINSVKKIFTYFSPDTFMVNGKKSLAIPSESNSLQWIANSGKGLEELIVICATSPFTKTNKYLYEDTTMKPDKEQFINLENPQKFISFILDDLHESVNKETAENSDENNKNFNFNSSEVYAFNLNNWVTFNFVYDIV